MSSFRQIEANHRNAHLSTGPVTEDAAKESRGKMPCVMA
jgi:hypothetical protein